MAAVWRPRGSGLRCLSRARGETGRTRCPAAHPNICSQRLRALQRCGRTIPRPVPRGRTRTHVRYNMHMREEDVRATDIGMVPLGYGRFVRADEIVASLPIEDGEAPNGEATSTSRGSRRRSWRHDRRNDPRRHQDRESLRPPRNAVRRPHRTAHDLRTSSPKPPGLRRPTRLTARVRDISGCGRVVSHASTAYAGAPQ